MKNKYNLYKAIIYDSTFEENTYMLIGAGNKTEALIEAKREVNIHYKGNMKTGIEIFIQKKNGKTNKKGIIKYLKQ